MISLKKLIPQVLIELEARRIIQPETEQLGLFDNVYELYTEERTELNRIFSDFERSFEIKRQRIA